MIKSDIKRAVVRKQEAGDRELSRIFIRADLKYFGEQG